MVANIKNRLKKHKKGHRFADFKKIRVV